MKYTAGCVTCGQAHTYGPDGWYADNGHGRHPYAPGQAGAATPEPTIAIRPGYRGGLAIYPPVACDRCHCLIANDRTTQHRDVCAHQDAAQ